MNPINWINIKVELTKKNKAYGWVLSDLETLEEIAKKLAEKFPAAAAIPDELYLQLEAIHVLIISKFEYLLKSLGKIRNRDQRRILKIIEHSKCLTQLEKDNLTYLFLIRHTIVHNGRYFDEKFFENAKRQIKELKLEIPRDNHHLSPLHPSTLRSYIGLIKKIILLDIAGDILSEEEKKLIEGA